MTHRVSIPTRNLNGGIAQIEGLLRGLRDEWLNTDAIVLDFTRCDFITAEAIAMLSALKLNRASLSLACDVDWATVKPDVRKQLGRWDWTNLFDVAGHRWADNAIPLLHQRSLAATALEKYVSDWALTRMPAMTAALAKETRRSLCELFTNIFQHAGSSFGGIAIGQYYPNIKQVQICVCDGGIGMVRRIQEAGYANTSSPAAIQWALELGHSTRGDEGCPGGLGLFLLRDFVKLNGGSFRIYANAGYFEERAGKPLGQELSASFPGTLIDLRLCLRDDVVYCLSSELTRC